MSFRMIVEDAFKVDGDFIAVGIIESGVFNSFKRFVNVSVKELEGANLLINVVKIETNPANPKAVALYLEGVWADRIVVKPGSILTQQDSSAS